MRNKEGLLVSKKIDIDDKNKIVIREVVNNSDKELFKAKENFEKLKNEGVIVNELFTDNRWILTNIREKDEILSRTNIKFNLLDNLFFNNSLKCYAINLLVNYLNNKAISQEVKVISNVIKETRFFDKNYLEEFKENFFECSETTLLRNKDIILKYISFMKIKDWDEYTELFESISHDINKNTREIVNYKSVLYFDYFINKELENKSKSNLFYYPIFLWWKITSKIPMRPIEFLKLKKNCIFIKDGKYYITLTRQKPHGYVDRINKNERVQTFRINKEIYDLYQTYVNDVNHSGEYMLSNSVYNAYLQASMPIRVSYNRLSDNQLTKVLNIFYEKIIKNKYSVDYYESKKQKSDDNDSINSAIQKIKLGDTRHLAIINLVLQGVNPYIVKEMAGHRDINSHLHYIQHAKEYISCKVLTLTDIHKYEDKMMHMGNGVKYDVGNKRMRKIQLSNSDKYLKVGNYYCKRYIGMENLFPNLCINTCDNCNDAIIIDATIDNINEKIKYTESEIEKHINIIKSYVVTKELQSVLDKKRKKYYSESQEMISESANKLEYLISEKARLEFYKFKNNIVE